MLQAFIFVGAAIGAYVGAQVGKELGRAARWAFKDAVDLRVREELRCATACGACGGLIAERDARFYDGDKARCQSCGPVKAATEAPEKKTP